MEMTPFEIRPLTTYAEKHNSALPFLFFSTEPFLSPGTMNSLKLVSRWLSVTDCI